MAEFTEVQSYGWPFGVAAVLITLGVLLLIWRFVENRRFAIVCFIPFVLLMLYFMIQRLETRIDEKGIHYKLFPLQMSERNIEWYEVGYTNVSSNIIYSRAVRVYDTYTIFDKYGLYLFLSNGERIILGTKKPEEMKRILKYYRR